MNETVHLSGLWVALFGTLLSVLLGVIAFFLSRLLAQFDALNKKVGEVNDTMLKIDKDLSGRVAVLDNDHGQLKEKVDELDPIWDRMRLAEDRLTKIESGGCSRITRCEQ